MIIFKNLFDSFSPLLSNADLQVFDIIDHSCSTRVASLVTFNTTGAAIPIAITTTTKILKILFRYSGIFLI